ncbi:GDSL-like Lipase/Acylhydrolase [Rubripirellula obstinata]|uniref:GDSL-like Lipase/Acylhydrolase n=1 Tax=Rubripirellula obstinata TaxID=406547 RepID=A0A5B1CR90_9BACT|nr:GDSL-type esterase/lipase family protein [Rubripirellula obstinata]KAA1262485.1 GDSL-like Lipase/Acylhydrolase [Rubripirellula obstinata]
MKLKTDSLSDYALQRYLLVLAVLFSNACFFHTVASGETLRILPLGDSTTAGYTDNPGWDVPYNHGYRSGLYNRLTSAGVDFTFVGQSPEAATDGTPLLFIPKLVTGDWSFGGTRTPATDLDALGQNNHRGYGGAQSAGTNNLVRGWLQADDPDIVLLMMGTNDRNATNLDTLIGTIVDEKPNAHIILSEIIPLRTDDLDLRQSILTFNDAVRNEVFPKYLDLGANVSLVDHYTDFLVNPNDPQSIDNSLMATFNHPNNDGYERIAQNFFEGIQAVTAIPEPSSICLLAVASLGFLRRRRSKYQ